MKTLTKTMITMMMVASATLFIACNKKSEGGQPIQTSNCNGTTVMAQGYFCNNGIITPLNTVVGTGNLLNNVQFQTSYLQGTVSLNATTTGGNGQMFDLSNPEAIYFYYGGVQVNGTLQVLNNSLCGAPVGSYNLQGTGNAWEAMLGNMQLIASGPAQIQLMVYSAEAYNPSGLSRDSAGNRLMINAAVSVNGNYCPPNVITY